MPRFHYRLIGSGVEAGSWGHEYVRNLAGEISAEFQHREEQDADVQDLLDLVAQITPYHMSHNAEPDAVDLLLEVDKLEWLAQYVDDKNYVRTCLYLVSCCAYLAEPDDTAVLRTAFDLYTQCKKYVDAMRIALRMNDHGLILGTMTACPDTLHKKQLAFLLARHGVLLTYEEEEQDAMEDAPQVQTDISTVNCCNVCVMQARAPQSDVYKQQKCSAWAARLGCLMNGQLALGMINTWLPCCAENLCLLACKAAHAL